MSDRRHTSRRGGSYLLLLLEAVVFVGALSLLTPAAEAQSSFREGSAVRRRMLFRSDRVEVTPSLAASLGNPYQRELMLYVTGRYHLTNDFSIGASVGAGTSFDSQIVSDFQSQSALTAQQVDFAYSQALLDFHVAYVPIWGKFNLFGDHIFHYDWSLAAGVGGALRTSDSTELSGFRFGPVVSTSFRLFVNDWIAVSLGVADYIFPAADAVRAGTEPDQSFRNHWYGIVGASLFFPKNVRVSR